jgi:hypothetical protein
MCQIASALKMYCAGDKAMGRVGRVFERLNAKKCDEHAGLMAIAQILLDYVNARRKELTTQEEMKVS